MNSLDDLLISLTATAFIEDGEVELTAGDRDYIGWMDLNLITLGRCSLAKDGKKNSNWVEKSGGLPNYICEIARSIHRKRGLPVSRAIAIAVGVVKRWAKGGGDVDASTQAKAAAAVASWEKKKAATRGKK